jgi:hypothetical protein
VPQAEGAPPCGRDLRNQRILLHKFAKPAIPLNMTQFMGNQAGGILLVGCMDESEP